MYMVFDPMLLAYRSFQLLQNTSGVDSIFFLISIFEIFDLRFADAYHSSFGRLFNFEIFNFAPVSTFSTLQPLWFKQSVSTTLVLNAPVCTELQCSPSWTRINNGGNNTMAPRHPLPAMDLSPTQCVITTNTLITNIINITQTSLPIHPQPLQHHPQRFHPNPCPHPQHLTTQRLHSLALYPPTFPTYLTHGPPATHIWTQIPYMVTHYSGRSSRRNGPGNTTSQDNKSSTFFRGSSAVLAYRTTASASYPKDATQA